MTRFFSVDGEVHQVLHWSHEGSQNLTEMLKVLTEMLVSENTLSWYPNQWVSVETNQLDEFKHPWPHEGLVQIIDRPVPLCTFFFSCSSNSGNSTDSAGDCEKSRKKQKDRLCGRPADWRLNWTQQGFKAWRLEDSSCSQELVLGSRHQVFASILCPLRPEEILSTSCHRRAGSNHQAPKADSVLINCSWFVCPWNFLEHWWTRAKMTASEPLDWMLIWGCLLILFKSLSKVSRVSWGLDSRCVEVQVQQTALCTSQTRVCVNAHRFAFHGILQAVDTDSAVGI